MCKMYSVLLLSTTILSFSFAAPAPENAQAKIISYRNVYEHEGTGNYDFSFETSNGIFRQESGKLVNVGEPDEHFEVHGAYSYTDPEGNFVLVQYTADESGYHIEEGVSPPLKPISVQAGLSTAVVATLLG